MSASAVIRGVLGVTLLVHQGSAQSSPTSSPVTTASIANPQVVYVTKYKGTWCNGPIDTIVGYPLGECIQTVDESGVPIGGMKLSKATTSLQTIINIQTYSSITCGDAGTSPVQWWNTLRSSGNQQSKALDALAIYNGAFDVTAVDSCTEDTYAGVSFQTTLGAVAPTVSSPNPNNYPAMKISSYVPACKNSQAFGAPVVTYESVMNTCYSTGESELFHHDTYSLPGYPTMMPTPASMLPKASSTLPAETVMGLQSANAVCINGLITEQYYANPVCSPVETDMIGYAVSKGPNQCISAFADMQIPGVAMPPQLWGTTTTQGVDMIYYAGGYKLVTCSGGDPVPANAGETSTGWAYTAAFTGPACTGELEAMHMGHPTNLCIYDAMTQGGVMYKCDTSGGGGYTAYYYEDPGCTKASSQSGVTQGSSVVASQDYPGSCQTDPSTFSPKMKFHKSPNFASQMNMCLDNSPRLPVGLGVTMIKKENADCTGRTVGFWSLSFGAHNTTDFSQISQHPTSNPQVYSTLSCTSDTCKLGGYGQFAIRTRSAEC